MLSVQIHKTLCSNYTSPATWHPTTAIFKTTELYGGKVDVPVEHMRKITKAAITKPLTEEAGT